MPKYTPSIDEVADRYVRDCMDHIGRTDAAELHREFARWLARERADAIADALIWAANFALAIQSHDGVDESAQSLQEHARKRLRDHAARVIEGTR